MNKQDYVKTAVNEDCANSNWKDRLCMIFFWLAITVTIIFAMEFMKVNLEGWNLK